MKKIAAILFIAAVLTSCSKDNSDSVTDSLELKDALNLQTGQVSSFDPLDAFHANHIHLIKQIYNTLTDINQQGDIVPSIAKTWRHENGLRWIFELRDDVYFTDDNCFNGDPKLRKFSSQDVIYSIARLLAPDSKSLGINYFKHIAGFQAYHEKSVPRLSGIHAPNEKTVVFELSAPDYFFDRKLSIPFASIVSKSVIECELHENNKLHPVGTGPFVLSNYTPGEKIVLNKNSDYWETIEGVKLPYVNKLTLNLITDSNHAIQLFRNGKLNFLDLDIGAYKQLTATDSTITIQSHPWAQINFYLVNLQSIPENDYRNWLAGRIKTQGLNDILHGQGDAAETLFPPALFPKLAAINRSAFQKNHHSVLEDYKKKRALKLVTFNDIMSKAIGNYVVQRLAEHGQKVQVEAVSFSVLVDRLTKGEYDLIQLYWGPLYADPRHFLSPFLAESFPPGGNNFNKYTNKEVNELVSKSSSVREEEATKLLATAAQKILEDMPLIPLYFGRLQQASDDTFTMPFHPLGYRFYKLAARAK